MSVKLDLVSYTCGALADFRSAQFKLTTTWLSQAGNGYFPPHSSPS